MEHTKNYHLPQWVESDRIMMEDFNDAMEKIDSGLEELGSRMAAEQEATEQILAEVQADLGINGKNLRIATGSYVGTGTYGKNNPTSLTFDLNPLMIFFSEEDSEYLPDSRMIWPVTVGFSTAGGGMQITWGKKSVSWYTLAATNPGINQNNTYNITYRYTVLGYDD